MARSKTNTVEYFPHIAKQGKTLFILEGKYGNDGYAFWFKLLEILASTENHYYDASNISNWQYLVARAKITDESATEMLSLLANLGNIDADLWFGSKKIWCQALVDNLTEVYRKRLREVPNKPICDRKANNCDRNTTSANISDTENTQSKVKESIYIPPQKKSTAKKIKTSIPDNYSISPEVQSWADKKGHKNLDQHLERFIELCKSNGYTAVDWDMKFRRAIREDWGKVNNGNVTANFSKKQQPAQPSRPPNISPDDWNFYQKFKAQPYGTMEQVEKFDKIKSQIGAC